MEFAYLFALCTRFGCAVLYRTVYSLAFAVHSPISLSMHHKIVLFIYEHRHRHIHIHIFLSVLLFAYTTLHRLPSSHLVHVHCTQYRTLFQLLCTHPIWLYSYFALTNNDRSQSQWGPIKNCFAINSIWEEIACSMSRWMEIVSKLATLECMNWRPFEWIVLN